MSNPSDIIRAWAMQARRLEHDLAAWLEAPPTETYVADLTPSMHG